MKGMKNLMGLGCFALAMLSCTGSQKQAAELTNSGLNPQQFESTIDGKQTHLITLTNKQGMEVCVTNFGGRIVSIMVPDKEGKMQDVVLGLDSVGAYQPQVNMTDFGASIGRYANRINKGILVMDGDTIQLPKNSNGHCLHGGTTGWQYQVYEVGETTPNSVQLIMNSADGDNNFPGAVKAVVTYTLTDDNAIDIHYSATTDKKTVINMTNHSYFNLSGNPKNTVLDNVLMIDADNFTPVDSTLIPTGELLPVAGTPLDFRTSKVIGKDIEKMDFAQLRYAGGYDHNWVLNTSGDDKKVCARLESPVSGIVLEVFTNEPGIQVYTGNFLDGTVVGKKGLAYQRRTGICLETQHYPDTPNQPNFPTVVLEPGETYQSHCIFKFSVKK